MQGDCSINVAEVMREILAFYQVDNEKETPGEKLQNDSYGSKYLDNMIREYEKKQGIVILGTGKDGEFLYDIISRKTPAKIESMNRVVDLKDILNKYPEAYFIISSTYSTNEIFRELLSSGVAPSNISVFIKEYI